MEYKQIELAARQYATKTQLMSNYPHDWQSSYDAYIQGATDALQANEADTSEKVYCDVCNGTGKLG